MIGIIQPKNNNNDFFMMGCIGKITSYIETPDYRLVLNLEGVCRFVLHERNLTPKGYYQANIDTSVPLAKPGAVALPPAPTKEIAEVFGMTM